MSKIEYKAKSEGIKVVKIPYKELHRWCFACGAPTVTKTTDENGEPMYVCTECGQVIDRDVSIPKSLIIPDIDKIIKDKEKTSDK